MQLLSGTMTLQKAPQNPLERETQFFFELTPEKILESVEKAGYRTTGRCLTLNSMENRVYEVELELDEAPKNKSDKFKVVKFYRPNRWTKDQILEEHSFLLELKDNEIPVVAPEKFLDGSTLLQLKDMQMYFTVFPKQGGRSPDELSLNDFEWVGRLLGRLHAVGASKPNKSRLTLDVETYGVQNLKILQFNKSIAATVEPKFIEVCENLFKKTRPLFEGVSLQRIHGDCHLGNLIFGAEGYTFVDFDDMVKGPCVQDAWLLFPDRIENCPQQWNSFLEGYESFHTFNKAELRLVEALRALRMLHFSVWISKRWQDPAFQRAFPNFGTERYWEELCLNLQDQVQIIE
jgi:Ser/Thr protein kinase RdoA (MazF antagonist)